MNKYHLTRIQVFRTNHKHSHYVYDLCIGSAEVGVHQKGNVKSATVIHIVTMKI